jgi:hypothetical protein
MTPEERFEKWWNNPNTIQLYSGFAENHYDIPMEQLKDIVWKAFYTGYSIGYLKGIE